MKALLRSSIFALVVFAGYAAVATDISKPHSNAAFPSLSVRLVHFAPLASNTALGLPGLRLKGVAIDYQWLTPWQNLGGVY